MHLREIADHEIRVYNTRDQLMRHVYHRSDEAFAEGDRKRDALSSIPDVEARKTMIRAEFFRAIGGLPSMDHPLNARVTGAIEEESLRIEQVIYESRPDTYVTANLYLPRDVTSPTGAVLFLCGHHVQGKHEPEYQIVCRFLAAAGLVVLAQDPIGQGERLSYYEPKLRDTTVGWGTTEHDYAGRPAFLTGTGIARYFVHDAMRGFDYLESRPEVDETRIGVTGNSGGGTQTSMMLLADSRIAAAVPATFIMNRQSYMYSGQAQDAEQIWPGMSSIGFDHEDILLMGVPKPMHVLAVSWDFFPIEGTHRTVERCKRIWELYGKGRNLGLFVDDSTHKYTRRMAIEASLFFARHLLERKTPALPDEVEAIEPRRLWCTPNGQVRAQFARAVAVFEENRTITRELVRRRKHVDHNRRRAWLRERVFAHRLPCPQNHRLVETGVADGLQVGRYLWWTQHGILNHGIRLTTLACNTVPKNVTLALWDGGTRAIGNHAESIKSIVADGSAVFVLDVTGTGAVTPNHVNTEPMHESYGTLFKLADDLLWLDDSLAAMRVYDVTQAITLLESLGGKDTAVEILVEGRQGLYGVLANWVDQRITAVRRGTGVLSYQSLLEDRYYDDGDIMGVVIPGILEHVDIDEILGTQQ